jgi:hypothetical protein
MQKWGMAKLDSDDLKAIAYLIEAKMDEVVGELKASREEQAVLSHRVSDHEDRIEKIEAHLSISSD